MKLGSARLVQVIGSLLAVVLVVTVVTPSPAVAAKGGADFTSKKAKSAEPFRTTGREAAKKSAATPRKHHADVAPLARPKAFAATGAGASAAQAGTGRAPRVVTGPGLASTQMYDGIDQDALGGGAEPPDPWVAAGSSWVVQSTNGMVRVSTRDGVERASIASWALFDVPLGYVDSDPRILWDPVKGRWVGVVVFFDYPAFSDNYISLIVSDGSDPLGGWSVYQFWYGSYLPDYPGIASSSDKLVVTANEFLDGMDYAGSSLLTIPWSPIIAGTDVGAAYNVGDFAWNLRPGRMHQSSADLHLVYENEDTGTLWYMRLSGSALAPSITEQDLGLANGGLLQAPRQPGDADGIAYADDGRIPDAVWRSNHLWFARTVEYAYNGTDPDLAIEVIDLTTSSSGGATVNNDYLVGGPSGYDSFTPGIGHSANGTTFLTYSQSSDATPPAVMAAAFHPTLGFQGPITIAESDASYDGARWGDFAGIATDPSSSGHDAVWQAHEVATASGGWRTVVSRLVMDVTPPTATAPTQALVRYSTLGQYGTSPGYLPVKVSWTAADSGSGIHRSYLDVDEFGTGYWTALTTTATSVTRAHAWKPYGWSVNRTYKYRVTPEDEGLNVGSSVSGSLLTPYVYQQTTATSYSGTWSNSTSTSYSSGSARYSTRVGASATFKAYGRSFAFVTTRAKTRGKFKVYVDGVYKGTVSLWSSTTKYRNLAYVISFSSSGTHSVKVVVASGRVDVDAFAVLK